LLDNGAGQCGVVAAATGGHKGQGAKGGKVFEPSKHKVSFESNN
jgi:hypothetical protein